MAKDKERSVNPAQQQRKADKLKALKKSKAELQSRRNEKLARRNPDRLQRQIDDLKALEASGDIKAREKTILDELERDLKAVRKAREALGEKAPPPGNRQTPRRNGGDNPNSSVLGKRRFDGTSKPYRTRHEASGSDTDDSVRRIPMPEDTPPPIPREHRRYFQKGQPQDQQQLTQPIPVVETKLTYSAAPQIRDLKKEAVSKFVPNIVRQKQAAIRGTGSLVEPEEMDKLEAAGYLKTNHDRDDKAETGPDVDMEADKERRLAEEEARFQRELAMLDVQPEQPEQGDRPGPRNVEIEDVEDEDA